MPTSKDFWLQFDSTRESIWCSMSPVGWVSWNMLSTLCFGGIGVLLYEGVPYFLSPTYFWDLVEKHKLTNLFLPANVVDDLEKLGYFPTKEHNLSSVKVAIAGGSVVKPQAYDFMYNKIKKDILFSTTYGFVAYPHRPMTLHSPTENSLAVLNHKILEANSQVQNVKLGVHQTCLSINRLWHELCVMLRRLVGPTAPGNHDCSIQE
ncbi:acetoacetyl-CoA synthetase [Trichonephila clavipes]|nr:acetoacetyl-CoA synthetase [Trichonephila clavipes]